MFHSEIIIFVIASVAFTLILRLTRPYYFQKIKYLPSLLLIILYLLNFSQGKKQNLCKK